jgi:hypothetical protein
MCSNYLSILYRLQGDVERVRSWTDRSVELARQAERAEYVAMGGASYSWLAWKAADLESAEAQARAALRDFQALHTSLPVPFWWAALWVLIDIALRRQRTDEAIADARLLFGPDQARVPEPLATHLHAAFAAWDRGDSDEAAMRLSVALECAKRCGYL